MLVYLLSFSSGKKYVGQTQRTIAERMSGHRARLKVNSTSPLYSEWRSFGAPTVAILERCETTDELHSAERKWIKSEDSIWPQGLNFAEGGLSSASQHSEAARKIGEAAKGRKASDETKVKVGNSSREHWKNPEYRAKVIAGIHASNTPERLAQMAKHLGAVREKRKAEGWQMSEASKQKMRDRVISDEQRQKMSESAKKRVREPRSQETKDKIAAKTRAFWANKRSAQVDGAVIQSEQTKETS